MIIIIFIVQLLYAALRCRCGLGEESKKVEEEEMKKRKKVKEELTSSSQQYHKNITYIDTDLLAAVAKCHFTEYTYMYIIIVIFI